jgi:hypothetical protein
VEHYALTAERLVVIATEVLYWLGRVQLAHVLELAGITGLSYLRVLFHFAFAQLIVFSVSRYLLIQL